MILITDTFLKNINKIKSIKLENILIEINKYEKGLNNFIEILDIDGNKVYKGYLLSKKVRLLVYYKKVGKVFIPFYVVKKETKYGYNITSNLEDFYFRQLDKNIEDIENKNFKNYN